jgi:N-acetylglucosamine kinase-like BadF-type ATPase
MAETPKIALKLAKKRGKEEALSYFDDGIEVLFEFIGVKELIELGACYEPDEVWSSFFEKIEPMENKNKIIPKEDKLHALCLNTNRNKLSVPGKRLKKKASPS